MTPTQSHWEEEYKSLYNLFCHERSISKKLKLEIRSLHRKLRDANRGAERNAHAVRVLINDLFEYKIKHPEKSTEDVIIDNVVKSMEAHTAKILQQQQDGI